MVLEANIRREQIVILKNLIQNLNDFESINAFLFDMSGIESFFPNQYYLDAFKTESISELASDDRKEFGDFQTNLTLSIGVCELLKSKSINPEYIIEPTCGKGNFILAAIKVFDAKEIIGIEIHEPYLWYAKFSILEYYYKTPKSSKPKIRFINKNVFDVRFDDFKKENVSTLILGNPPWVTNATLSALESDNTPFKSNFKKHLGLDAMTGKGNFDIGEYVSLMLLRTFHEQNGQIAFLIKNSVAKNLLLEQKQAKFRISNIEKYNIDAKKEFAAAVDACLFVANFNQSAESTCRNFDFYTQEYLSTFGWYESKFVSDVQNYEFHRRLDGLCSFEWRQGVKHDCSKIMELEVSNGTYLNGKDIKVQLENELVYGFLKSSDLKNLIVNQSRKYTIITQKKVGQDTLYIRDKYPLTWQYLIDNKADFDNRKSSIYRDKPPFSIFGIGDYSFQPYKVAISGLYKTLHFSLVLPQQKPLMLDDTCYFLGFQHYPEAVFSFVLLNTPEVASFLSSIIFEDSKRAITKDILMRIDLKNVLVNYNFENILTLIKKYNLETDSVDLFSWERYTAQLLTNKHEQLSMF